jgi:hypothetical protein
MRFRLWKFAPEFDPRRREELYNVPSFAEVISMLEGSVHDVHVKAEPGREPELVECLQPVFTLSVSGSAFDAFFNSPNGYRGCYLQHVNLGVAANLDLVAALHDRLVDNATRACIPELGSIDVSDSLRATSCKAWIHEDDFPFQDVTKDLAVDAWLSAAASGAKKANWGLCAPKGSRIQIKGALLDPHGHEVVPRTKVLRRYEIQRFGFS